MLVVVLQPKVHIVTSLEKLVELQLYSYSVTLFQNHHQIGKTELFEGPEAYSESRAHVSKLEKRIYDMLKKNPGASYEVLFEGYIDARKVQLKSYRLQKDETNEQPRTS